MEQPESDEPTADNRGSQVVLPAQVGSATCSNCLTANAQAAQASPLLNRDPSGKLKLLDPTITHTWRVQRELTLRGVAASGTLPSVREAEKIDGR